MCCGFERLKSNGSSRLEETSSMIRQQLRAITPALELAKALEYRFRNVDPNYFTTCSGRLLEIHIDWPPIPWMGQQGLIAASGLWVRITDLATKELAACPIIATHQQEFLSDGAIRFMRPAHVTKTIRSLIDQGAVTFYRNESDRPREFQAERLLTEGYVPQPRYVQDFDARKVWLLGILRTQWRNERDSNSRFALNLNRVMNVLTRKAVKTLEMRFLSTQQVTWGLRRGNSVVNRDLSRCRFSWTIRDVQKPAREDESPDWHRIWEDCNRRR